MKEVSVICKKCKRFLGDAKVNDDYPKNYIYVTCIWCKKNENKSKCMPNLRWKTERKVMLAL